MAAIRSVPFSERHRDCKGRMVPSRRHGPGDIVTDVSCCFTCGLEDPPLYDRSAYARNGEPYPYMATCEWCGKEFSNSLHTIRQRYCAISCATAVAGQTGRFGSPARRRAS